MNSDDLTRIDVDQYLPHPPAKVWRALTTPELIEQWLMPTDFEPIVGRSFTFQSSPVAQTDFSGTIACRVLELDPPTCLRISWADAAAPDRMVTQVTWTLEPEGVGTRLFLAHTGFDPDVVTQQTARRLMGQGWSDHIPRQLRRVLDQVM